jgi:hypothetical protein
MRVEGITRMTRYQRSLQLWSLLICAARERKLYPYGQVAKILGMSGAGVIGQFLAPIVWYCQERGLPPLTVLVVNQDSGLPGDGLATLEEVNQDRERVFTWDWFALEPPETKDFEEADTRASLRACWGEQAI